MTALLIALAVVIGFAMALAYRTVRVVPQARAGVVERLGRYQRTLNPGLAVLRPFVDRLKPLIDLREQVVSFSPQPVITQDNLVVQIDTVILPGHRSQGGLIRGRKSTPGDGAAHDHHPAQ